MQPLILRTRRISENRYRVWSTVDGRRVRRTVTVDAGAALPHAAAAAAFAPIVGAVADTAPLWGAASLPTIAFQAWA